MRAITTTAIAIVAIGLLAGSAVEVTARTADIVPTPSAGCVEPLAEPGVYEGINELAEAPEFVTMGADPGYRVVVPEGYAEMAPAPLILWLAAGSGSVEQNLDWWRPYLHPAESVFVVSGRLTQAPTLTGLLDQLSADYCIDTRQVHMMGASSSVSAVARLACEAPDRIGSFFAGIGTFSTRCAPEHPVPLMAMTGDADRDEVSASVEAWADAYGCDGGPIVDDLGSGVTRTAYQGCQADIVLYDVDGVGHGFIRSECIDGRFDYCYENDVFDQLREVERFFGEHPLP